MKVREVINAAGWVDGSGFSYETTIEDHIVEVDEIPAEMDWSWLEPDEQADGEDTLFTVTLYALTDEDMKAPLAEYKTWASEVVG
jgi:hypothetical protein